MSPVLFVMLTAKKLCVDKKKKKKRERVKFSLVSRCVEEKVSEKKRKEKKRYESCCTSDLMHPVGKEETFALAIR